MTAPEDRVDVSVIRVDPSSDKHATGLFRRLKASVMGHLPKLAL